MTYLLERSYMGKADAFIEVQALATILRDTGNQSMKM